MKEIAIKIVAGLIFKSNVRVLIYWTTAQWDSGDCDEKDLPKLMKQHGDPVAITIDVCEI